MKQEPQAALLDDPFAGQRNIWTLWLQGADAAPELVDVCRRTWVEQNPGWRVHFLSKETVGDYLTEEFRRHVFSLDLPPQKIANLIRLHLISRHGGVWADADCYCVQPLDRWLPQLMTGGFFAFRFPGDAWLNENRDRPLTRLLAKVPDRIMDNWFLAGTAGNFLGASFLEKHMELLTAGEFGRRRRRRGILRLALLALRRNPYTSSKLSSLRLLRAARTFPYLVFHYHFARAVLTDAAFDAAWRTVPTVTALNALRYSKWLHLLVDEAFLEDMAGRGVAPVFKMHWDLTEGAAIPGSRYRWLVDQRQVDSQQLPPHA